MSLAEEMLANMSLEKESSTYLSNVGEEEHILVNESRQIIVPDSLKTIAVTGDKEVETVTFDCVRYWDGNDLSTFAIYLNYILPDGSTGTYIPESIRTTEGESIYHFDWLIKNNITKKSGKILFGITAIKTKTNDSGEPIIDKQWSSFVSSDCSIAVGIDISIVQEDEESSGIIEKLSRILEGVPVRGEYLHDDNYFPNNRSIDNLKSSADVGFYIGNGYSLIVTEGSEYGDYNTIHQIKIDNTGMSNGAPTISIRQYFNGGYYDGTWTEWKQVGELPTATAETLGGIKVGNGLSVDANDLLNVVKLPSRGNVYEDEINYITEDGRYDVSIRNSTDGYDGYTMFHLTQNTFSVDSNGDNFSRNHMLQVKLDAFGGVYVRYYPEGEAWQPYSESGDILWEKVGGSDYILPTASKTVKGGVIIGEGLSINSTGVLGANGLLTKGRIYDDSTGAGTYQIDTLYSPAQAGCYYGYDPSSGEWYTLLVVPSYDGSYSGAQQIKVMHSGQIFTRQSHGGDPFTEWVELGGIEDGLFAIANGELDSYHHSSDYPTPDDLKSAADVGFYRGENFSLLVTKTLNNGYGYAVVNQLKFSYEAIDADGNAKPTLQHRVYYNGADAWSDWVVVGEGNGYELTVEKLSEVIPEGFGYDLAPIKTETFYSTYYYTNVSNDSILNPQNMIAGDTVTLHINYSDGTATTLSCPVKSGGSDITLDFDNNFKLTLTSSNVETSSETSSEITYNLTGSEDISTWYYTVTRAGKINSKYLPEYLTETELTDKAEEWTFTLEDGSTVIKKVVLA